MKNIFLQLSEEEAILAREKKSLIKRGDQINYHTSRGPNTGRLNCRAVILGVRKGKKFEKIIEAPTEESVRELVKNYLTSIKED